MKRVFIAVLSRSPFPCARPNTARSLVGTSRCDVPARVIAGGTNRQTVCAGSYVAPLNAARTAQRAIPTKKGVEMAPFFPMPVFRAGKI
jgi:hypothetical protein